MNVTDELVLDVLFDPEHSLWEPLEERHGGVYYPKLADLRTDLEALRDEPTGKD